MSLMDAHSAVGPDGGDSPGADGTDDRRTDGSYAVKLPVFEGPLDLLLHLIRQNEVDIADIPIALIGKQYLQYIELMKELNIDVAAEYLVMAATLALIKSRMLLPAEQENEEGEEVDPRAELVARLLEYQRFKEAAEALSRRRLLGRDIFEARGPSIEPPEESEREIEVGLFELIEAFRAVLEQAREHDRVHSIETENVTVRERMIYVMELFEQVEHIEFAEIFQIAHFGAPSRAMLVAMHIFQNLDDDGAPAGPIRLRPIREPGAGPSWQERITETM
jgi:segregation and condensation protein A